MLKRVIRNARVVAVMIIAVVALSGCAGLQGGLGQADNDTSETGNGARTAEVIRGDISFEVSGTASFVPVKLTGLFFESVSGPLRKVYIQTNDHIKAGDPVAEVDPENITKEIERQEVTMQMWYLRKLQNSENLTMSTRSLNIARMNLDQASRRNAENPTEENAQELARQQILYEQAVSAEKNARWSKSLGGLQATLDEKTLAELKEKLEKSVLRAPVDGIVTFVESLNETEMVASGRVIARLAEPKDIVLQMLAVDARYIQDVSGGTLTIDSGKYDVELYSPQAGDLLSQDPSAGNRVYVKFREDNRPIIELEGVRNAFLEIKKTDVLIIPKTALRDLNGKTVVDVNKGNLLETVEVVRGIEQDGNVEIISGLEAGQVVVF